MPRISITLVCAKNLIAADTNGFSDPFVVVYEEASTAKKQKTKVKKKTLNPEFNQIFIFDLVESVNDACINFYVYDRDRFGSDDPIGHSFFYFSDLYCEQGHSLPIVLPLIDGGRGELHIVIKPLDFSLPYEETNAQAILPFVINNLSPREQQKLSRKSTLKKLTSFLH